LLDQVIDGRYCVEAVIGEGGMGTVYRVRHASLGRLLALKALRADLTNDAEISARFIHEARIAASVSHPGLVQIVDFGTLPSGQPYLVMELLDGMPLSAVLRRHGPLSPARAAAITCKIADALAVLHAAQVVHRDLKPDNIQVRDAEGADEIKVVDFGLAKIIGGSRFTRQGVVFGTPHYMSPEQASGQSIDVRADVYALGVVLYEMLVGRVPFEAETYMGVLTQHIYLKPTPPSQRLLGVSGMGPIERIVLRCLQKRPERRFQTMAELVAAIQALPPSALPHTAPSEAAAPLPPPPPELLNSSALTRPPAAQRRFWAWVALGGVAAAGLGWWVRSALSSAESASSAEPAAKVSRAPASVAEPLASAEEPPPSRLENRTSAPEPSPAAPAKSAKSASVPKLNPIPSALSSAPRPAHAKASGSRAATGSDIIDPWEKKR
jgi:serine/threonine-protein kinase